MSTPYWQGENVTLYHGDCIPTMAALPADSVDAIVCDPPYDLTAGKKGGTGEASLNTNSPAGRSRISTGGGFMGKSWDATGVAFDPVTWRAALRVLKPGGHLLAFGGTRTWHRLAVAVEDAGFEIRDSIAWLYGSGFPKSLDVSKAIDKAAGAQRPVTGTQRRAATGRMAQGDGGYAFGEDFEITAPATVAAQQWAGWGTAMKPAHEPIVWARKPFNLIPLTETHRSIGALLWLLFSPAKRAETLSQSSHLGQPGVQSVSALVNAATDTSPDESARTVTFNSPEQASTFSNIAWSWNVISAALSDPTTTFTTSMRSSTTTALKTLNSLLGPLTSQITTQANAMTLNGSGLTAPSAERDLIGAWENWTHTLKRSVPESAIEGIALAVASALASIAAELSGDSAAGSIAAASATAGVAQRNNPAFEPIVFARKPLVGTVAGNVQAYGTGALNIDSCRIGTGGEVITPNVRDTSAAHEGWVRPWMDDKEKDARRQAVAYERMQSAGRWPANVVLDADQAATLNQQSGDRPGGTFPGRTAKAPKFTGDTYNGGKEYEGRIDADPRSMGDTGGASRFFYVAKAPTAERPKQGGIAHPTVKPIDLMQWLVRLVTPPGGVVLDPFAGSGTTGEATIREGFESILIEREADYLPLIRERFQRPINYILDFGDPA